jgi:hypothetical protein
MTLQREPRVRDEIAEARYRRALRRVRLTALIIVLSIIGIAIFFASHMKPH